MTGIQNSIFTVQLHETSEILLSAKLKTCTKSKHCNFDRKHGSVSCQQRFFFPLFLSVAPFYAQLSQLSFLGQRCLMHMMLNEATLPTCGAETRTLLNLAQGCRSMVRGESLHNLNLNILSVFKVREPLQWLRENKKKDHKEQFALSLSSVLPTSLSFSDGASLTQTLPSTQHGACRVMRKTWE